MITLAGKVSGGVAIIVIIGVVVLLLARDTDTAKQKPVTIGHKSQSNMQLNSLAFNYNEAIPTKYTCDGENVSPPFVISDVPEGTQSLALIMDDPDVPTTVQSDGVWNHWVVFNIPPDTKEIVEGQEPAGVHGKGTSGDAGYYGPCPPDREHRYFFKIYALDTMLDLPEGSSKADVERVMEGHTLDKAELVGRYERS